MMTQSRLVAQLDMMTQSRLRRRRAYVAFTTVTAVTVLMCNILGSHDIWRLSLFSVPKEKPGPSNEMYPSSSDEMLPSCTGTRSLGMIPEGFHARRFDARKSKSRKSRLRGRHRDDSWCGRVSSDSKIN